MRYINDILSGIGLLIALYLVLSKGDAVSKVIKSLLESSTGAIKVLQGR